VYSKVVLKVYFRQNYHLFVLYLLAILRSTDTESLFYRTDWNCGCPACESIRFWSNIFWSIFARWNRKRIGNNQSFKFTST